MKSAIITYLDMNFVNNFMADFIPTIFNEGHFKGELHIISYGLREREKKIISGLNDKIIIYEVTKLRPVHIQRWIDILPILESMDSDVVMTIDAGDVWFQGDFNEIFELCKDRIGVIPEKVLCDEGWTKSRLDAITNEDFKVRFANNTLGRKLIGSGTICGNRQLMVGLFSNASKELAEIKENHLGVDQLALEIVAYGLFEDKILMLPHTYGFVTLKILNDYSISEDKKIVDKLTGEPVKIVHNAGGKFRTWASGRRGF